MAKKVLVVDDDPDLREAAEIILTNAGYDVVTAGSAAEAWKKLRIDGADLILLDVMMETDTEGFHMVYELRDNEKYREIPIVILTCIEERTGEVLEPEKAGDFLPVQAFLRKPLEAAKLKSTIAEFLK